MSTEAQERAIARRLDTARAVDDARASARRTVLRGLAPVAPTAVEAVAWEMEYRAQLRRHLIRLYLGFGIAVLPTNRSVFANLSVA